MEDDANIAGVLEDALKDAGYEVDICENGSHALQKMADHKSDLVILDVLLPEKDGLTLCKEIRSHPATQKIPIIMSTCLTDSSTLREALSYPAVDFVSKPFLRDDLLQKVKEALSK